MVNGWKEARRQVDRLLENLGDARVPSREESPPVENAAREAHEDAKRDARLRLADQIEEAWRLRKQTEQAQRDRHSEHTIEFGSFFDDKDAEEAARLVERLRRPRSTAEGRKLRAAFNRLLFNMRALERARERESQETPHEER